jgi:hypothetical protein
MGYDAAEMQDYLITMQNQQLYNEGRYYGGNGASAILGALSKSLRLDGVISKPETLIRLEKIFSS